MPRNRTSKFGNDAKDTASLAASLAEKVSKGELVINLKDYGAKGDNTDASGAFQQAINDILAVAKQLQGVGGKTYFLPKIVIPNGQYLINNPIVFNPSIPSTYNGDAISLVIEGSGYGTTLIMGTGNTMFDLVNGTVHFSNFRMLGDTGKTGFVLGRTTYTADGKMQMISQSTFKNINMTYWEKNFVVNHAFDTSFYDCGFFQFRGTSPIGFDIQLHSSDNTNNLQFYRCHWEAGVNATLFKGKGSGATSSQTHGNFGFHGCHFETRSFNTVVMDLEYVGNIGFSNTQLTQNNSPNGTTAGVVEANTVPMFKLNNVFGLRYDSCTVARQGTTSPPNKLFDLANNISGVSFKSSYIIYGGTNTNASLIDLWQNNATYPASFSEGRFATFDGSTHIGDTKTHPLFNDTDVLISSTTRNRKWTRKHNASTNALEEWYDQTAGSVTDQTPLFAKSTDGMFKANSFGGGFMQTITNGSTVTYTPTFINNPNKRGLYKVMADYNGDAFAIFFSTGSAVYPVFVGGTCTLGATNANTSGKLNIFLNGSNISINNQIGSDRRVSITVESFY